MESFNIRLKEAMDYKKVKPAELSKLTGIGKSSISQWLSGQYSAKQDKIFIIAKALNVNPSWLIGADVPMTNESTPEKIFNIANQLDNGRQKKLYYFANDQLDEQNKVVQLPTSNTVEVYGAVSAGTGEYMVDNQPEKVEYSGSVPEHDFAVTVNGDSMTPLFDDKQIIFVKKAHEARSGQIVIADYDGQAYVKKFVADDNGCRLVSLNKKYHDLPIDEEHEMSLFGIVVL
ncbi:XRE family transcriptional regulator [Fructobacillus fructosus]|uniref:XRE family transcriptional regulator n=1 Tax=Fructobacillus fructosus TaxID=1631 RepID=UPI001658A555|nr:S24 family peptidase [Fructobacillus fructosus]MBC9119197.1 LexA family transcriptional regulator [Fructobacillus fructosus]MBD9366394.1 LexA family transcriptional regulator [Leuconostoc mesenteroides]